MSKGYDSKVKKLVADVPIFAGLDEESLELLLSAARRIECGPDELIAREGESSNEMFVIGQGSVRVWKHFGTPRQVELATIGNKDFFGEMCILETLPRAATVQAMEDCWLVALKSSAFYRLHRSRPAQHGVLILNLARDLSRRVRTLHERFVT